MGDTVPFQGVHHLRGVLPVGVRKERDRPDFHEQIADAGSDVALNLIVCEVGEDVVGVAVPADREQRVVGKLLYLRPGELRVERRIGLGCVVPENPGRVPVRVDVGGVLDQITVNLEPCYGDGRVSRRVVLFEQVSPSVSMVEPLPQLTLY